MPCVHVRVRVIWGWLENGEILYKRSTLSAKRRAGINAMLQGQGKKYKGLVGALVAVIEGKRLPPLRLPCSHDR